jgi:hypothetical protein
MKSLLNYIAKNPETLLFFWLFLAINIICMTGVIYLFQCLLSTIF